MLVFDESTETDGRDHLVGFIRGKKFQDGVILVLGAKARHPLSAIHIERPHGRAVKSGNAGQKTAKGLLLVITPDDKTAAGG